MKNLKIRKVAGAVLIASLTLASLTEIMPGPLYYTNYSITSNYEQESPLKPYAHLEIGDVYIGRLGEIRKLDKETKRNNIIIIDQRHYKDPNIRILDSHKITNIEDMASIIEVIQEYNIDYPSKWDRTTISLINEWEVHNLCSNLSILPGHTDDVDLNNKDEFLYNSKLLTKILIP